MAKKSEPENKAINVNIAPLAPTKAEKEAMKEAKKEAEVEKDLEWFKKRSRKAPSPLRR